MSELFHKSLTWGKIVRETFSRPLKLVGETYPILEGHFSGI
jgi:hypothetical protein